MAATITTSVTSQNVRTPALPSETEIDAAGSRFDVEFLFTDFRLDPDGPCLYQINKTGTAVEKPVSLSHNGHALLELLIERKGKVVPWADIFDRVWHVGPKDMDRSNIHVLIHELRRVLGKGCIETQARHGYRLAVEVIERQQPSLKQKDEPAITTLYGLSPERLQQMIKEAVHQHWLPACGRDGPDQQPLKVTQNAAIELMRIIGQAHVPLERLPEKLVEVAVQYKLAMDRLAALNPQKPLMPPFP
jgi:DNA-binding winged helix-turn-helix (wHTH) protein